MANFGTLEKIALSLPEVEIEPHFEKISFRIKKKIFATYDETNNRATVKLSEIDQEIFSSTNPNIYQVDNKWGKQGWTFIDLEGVRENLLKDVITAAYCEVAPKQLANKVRPLN